MSDYNFKYRPQKISELDLTQVREGLKRVLSSGKIPHAFLFSGPKGIGKTSAARILAKSVNCVDKREKDDFEPCNNCTSCLSITAGNNLDVLEIDAASNRGIDDIRDLREKVNLAPASNRFKVYIIDEAHMLTTEAFNALLKTLEEPPGHVIFVLATTEPEKLPETIISRCTRINFKKANSEEIVAKLKKIVAEEKLVVTDDALEIVAKGASGSFRDALKILEQATFAGEKITREEVKEILGQTLGLAPEKLLELLVKRDVKGAMIEIGHVVQMGANLRIYTTQLLELLRGLLLAKLGLVQEEKEINLSVDDIRRLIEIFSRSALELREAVIPQLPLELAVVEWCGEENEKSESEEDSKKVEVERESLPPPRPNGKKVSLEDVQGRWRELLLAVRPRNYSIEAFLRAARPVGVKDSVLTLEVFYQFHRDKLDSEKCRSIIEEIASEMFGSPLTIKCTLGEKPVRAKPVVEEQEEEKGASFAQVESDHQKGGNGESKDEDILKVAEEIFNGKGVN